MIITMRKEVLSILTSKNDILIEKCQFTDSSASTGASIYIKPDYTDYTSKAQITISECNFKGNKATQSASVYIETGSTKSLQMKSCTFDL